LDYEIVTARGAHPRQRGGKRGEKGEGGIVKGKGVRQGEWGKKGVRVFSVFFLFFPQNNTTRESCNFWEAREGEGGRGIFLLYLSIMKRLPLSVQVKEKYFIREDRKRLCH